MKEGAKIAAVRVAGRNRLNTKIVDTLDMLRLRRKNTCVVLENKPEIKGMIEKVKEFVTYGEIDAETEKLLVEKRGETDKDGKMKKFFRLSPPRKGWERKGTKLSFNIGGALGYRGEKINDLIKRMI